MKDHDATIDTDSAALPGVDDGRVHETGGSEGCSGPSLRLGAQVFPLRQGENVVGRGDDADVRLALSSVSRRHAAIRIDGGGAVLEDLKSRNGTTARDGRVNVPMWLCDGDAVRFGVVWLVYRSSAGEGSIDES